MNFSLTEEQTLLRDSLRRFLEREYGFERRRKQLEQGSPHRTDIWAAMADQGWLGATLTEASGGFGGPVEGSLIAQELGRVLVLEPYVAVTGLAAPLLALHTDSELATELLSSLIAGSAIPVLAHEESDAQTLASVATSATLDGDGYRLSGHKLQVPGAATSWLVSARTAGTADDEHGISLFHIPVDAAGLHRHNYRLIDGTPVADLTLEDVHVHHAARIGVAGRAYSALDTAHSHASTMLSAQAVGAMERAVEITRDYLKIRKQFGMAIGSFQALQHRLADMIIELEQARTMVYRALAYLNKPPEQRRHAVAATKAQIGSSAKYIAAQSIQLHGGIGVTEEYSIGHYFRFLWVAESVFGNRQVQLSTLGRMRSRAM